MRGEPRFPSAHSRAHHDTWADFGVSRYSSMDHIKLIIRSYFLSLPLLPWEVLLGNAVTTVRELRGQKLQCMRPLCQHQVSSVQQGTLRAMVQQRWGKQHPRLGCLYTSNQERQWPAYQIFSLSKGVYHFTWWSDWLFLQNATVVFCSSQYLAYPLVSG